jgi:hypothetical protein
MITGKQTLSSIDSTLEQQRDKIDTVEQRIEALGQRLVALQKQQFNDYRQLAQYRVNDIADSQAGGRLMGYLDDAEKRVRDLLQQRQVSLDALTSDIQHTEKLRVPLETERSAQADVLEALDEQIDDLEADTQQLLDADPAYQSQRERTTELRRIAQHAREKATRSESEREHKGAAYKGDALFMYLFKRHYGTSDYRANRLVRSLDGWVAKLVRYGDARANYQRLVEIPQRLDEHALRTEQEAEIEFRALELLDTEALKAHGVAQLEAQQQQEQDTLDAIDARIDTVVTQYQELLARKEHFATGEDENFQAIVGFLSAQFVDDDLRELREDALATAYPEDDEIIERLINAEDEKADIALLSQKLKSVMAKHRDRLQELESTRKEFKARRYDNPRSGFSDGAMVGVVLGELLNGALKSKSLWDVLEQQQRPQRRRSRPDFGSGGFGRGTPWGGNAPQRGPSHRGRSGGGFGGGGFSTGGGFGGGDNFRTGGGF